MIHLKLVRTTPDRFWFGPGLKNVALGWNEKRLLKYRRFEASALMPWIYSVRWRHINQWPCRHPMKDHFLIVIDAIQSVALFWRENFDFKFMISDHKWLNRKLIKTFFVISKFMPRIKRPNKTLFVTRIKQYFWYFENDSFLILHTGSQHDVICFLPSPRTWK